MSGREPLVVGIDVGGSKVLAAEIGPAGEVLTTATRVTPGRLVEVGLVEDALTLAVEDVAQGRPVAAVGLAAAGFVDAEGERVMFAPHLPWREEPVRSRLEERWGTRVVLDNDANCAALAELEHGAAAGAQDAVVVTMGTGIGGAVVVGGQLRRGRNGMAGEFGHAQVVPDGHPCECGHRGCWEQYSSGNALVRLARARVGQEPTLLDDLCGGDPSRLTGPMITEAAGDGDLVARQAFASVGEWLGVGLANLVAALDPEVVVVGGGVSAAGDRLLEPARAALRRALVGEPHRVVPPLRRAHFGPEAGAVGGALMARAALG
ncbi:ROK family protein [Nocardioides flavescens]|uniref:ROK family protein n=1 Tax=Nocardioides flavescens TaxID=2691959 RepID=A0A6L7EVP5_9ACTN|nr:ROK family protein [Nocardioides flavescens]